MSKDYVEELMNILDRDADNGKFDDDESEFIIVDEEYDDNYDDDDDFIVIEDNSSNDEYSNDEWNDEFDNSLEEIQVIDTNYVPEDFYEEDLFDEKYSEKEKDNGVTIFDLSDDYDFNFNFDEKDKEIKNENTMLIQNTIDDRISKNIAKDIINSDVDMTLEEDDVNDNWILDDMFGNDLSKMLVEEEHQENEDFSDGSFADWVK